MDTISKLKFLRKIKSDSLFFSKFKEFLYQEKFLNQKYDPFLISINFGKQILKNIWGNKINFFEMEYTILPAAKPNIEINLAGNRWTKDSDLLSGMKVFFSKKYKIFCNGSLPIFKCKKTLQCEVIKMDIFSRNTSKMDRILSKEIFKKKYFFSPKLSFHERKNQWKKQIRCIFSSNGFLIFNKFIFYSIEKLFFKCYLNNKSLIRMNFGPEFRYNSRY